ncbi:hypothetical protein LTS10_008850 [Elasticomyces elasticus]|nr:hypothetical protein LTS10_008850 [Elasticomyces elasticus]
MSSPIMYSLLRLPPCLRTQAFRRTFTTTLRSLKQQRPTKKPLPPPTRQPSPSNININAPPKPPPAATARPPTSSYPETLLQSTDALLIYKAPPHRSFYITSYLLGGLLLVGTYNWAIVVAAPPPGVKDDSGSWGRYLMTAVTIGTTLVVSIMGTMLILAPVGMARSISLIRNKAGQAVLRIEKENPVPFMTRRKAFTTPTSAAFLDRRVATIDLDLTSIPLSHAEAFTESIVVPAVTPKLQFPPTGPVSRFLAAFIHDIRRMFYREGFAYLRVDGQGTYKLDLQHCELLDQGRPLDRLTTEDLQSGTGPVAWIRRRLLVS